MTKRTKIEGLSVKCIKKLGLSGAKWPKISQHFVKFVEILEKSNFLPLIVSLTIKCKNEGSLTKMCQGLLVTRSLLKIGSQWVKVGKNGGLSVKVSKKKVGCFWWHMARNPKLSTPPGSEDS